MGNKVIDYFYSDTGFAGFLAVTPKGVVIFGYDADLCDEHGYFPNGEVSRYSVHVFEDVAAGMAYTAELGL